MRDRGSPTRFRSTDASRPGVVLLHGIARTSRSLRRLERALQESGFATLNLDYQSRKKPLDALAADIHPAIIDFAETNNGPLHFVAHSMGGLLTRVYVAKYRPAQLAHVVMLGTPNGGSEVADLLKGLSIFRAFYGPSGLQLSTQQDITLTTLPPLDYAARLIPSHRSLSCRDQTTAGFRCRAPSSMAWPTTSPSKPLTQSSFVIPSQSTKRSPFCWRAVSNRSDRRARKAQPTESRREAAGHYFRVIRSAKLPLAA